MKNKNFQLSNLQLLGIILFLVVVINVSLYGQGKNHQWLLGNESVLDSFTTSTRARFQFTSTSSNMVQFV